MTDIHQWLAGLGLSEYAEAFETNRIGLKMLAELDHDILKDVGVSAAGDRISILNAARAAQTEIAPEGRDADAAPGIAADAERRQLTVMFCDLVGSTALSEKLDPEDLRDVMRAYQDACAGAIGRFDGHIAQTLGDGLMVYFGYPIAHEDDAQRAVRAGLGIVGAVEALSTRLEAEQGVTVAVRVGVHTGLVVAGEIGGVDTRGDMAVVGETPNIAARVESVAEPGTVVVGDRTRRLVGEVFDFDDLGPHDLKGLSAPMTLYRARTERAADSRFEAMHPAGLTPFVGRDEEIGLLLGRWGAAKGGEGQVVLLEGEPGIGKSRITDTLRELIGGDTHIRLQYQCSPFYNNSAFYPIITHLERAARFETDDPPEARLDKLETLIGADDREALALIGALLSLPIECYPALNISPQKQKERTIEVLVEQIGKLVMQTPILMIFEDLHWIDPSSLEVLDHVIGAIEPWPVLLVITFRPEFEPHWGAHSHVTAHSLNRLGKRQSALLVGRVTGDKALPEALMDQIVAKTDGVPLFIEELTKAVIETDIVTDEGDRYALSGAVDSLAIPDTLHDSLMARLDKLIPVKEVAQIGAVIGREFSHRLLEAISPMSEGELATALDKLLASQLVFRRGKPPDAVYIFKHALVQDAAYESLLRRDRQSLHKQIGGVLLATYPSIGETEPELIAHHYTEAGLVEDAIPYWLKAGQKATDSTALTEAVAHLTKGLEVLEGIASSEKKERHELDLKVVLGSVYLALNGWPEPEVEKNLSRAHDLSKEFGETKHLFAILYGRWCVYNSRSIYETALSLAQEMIAAGEKAGDSGLVVMGHAAAGITYAYTADFPGARRSMEKVVELYEYDKHAYLVELANHDPKCLVLGWASHWLWMQGRLEEARQAADEQIALARKLNHPFNLMFSYVAGAGCFNYMREPDEFLSWMDQSIQTGREQGIPIAEAFLVPFMRGHGLVSFGRYQEGYDELKKGTDIWVAIGGRCVLPSLWVAMSEALGHIDRVEDGLVQIDKTLSLIEEIGERWHEAEAHRVKGELLLSADNNNHRDAEICFLKGIKVARELDAKSWELRSSMSLARLWKHQNKSNEAHDLLAPVYDWFTEGFDTADLKDAKALLGELRP